MRTCGAVQALVGRAHAPGPPPDPALPPAPPLPPALPPAPALPLAPALPPSPALPLAPALPPEPGLLPLQTPDAQASPGAQRLSQRPQFVALVFTSAQLTPHRVNPAAQSVVHEPREHTWPGGQATPHPPQFVASELVSTHAPVQSTRPTAHPGAAPGGLASLAEQAHADAAVTLISARQEQIFAERCVIRHTTRPRECCMGMSPLSRNRRSNTHICLQARFFRTSRL
jgi:hypothetical protein